MEPNLNPVIRRIRKLLALANDAAAATDGERDNALRMVHNTLAKYNLDMADITSNSANDEPRNQEVAIDYGYPWAKTTANSIAKLFFCFYYSSRHATRNDLSHHVFVGKTSNVITAKEMSIFVIRSILKQANHLRTHERQSWTWHTGFCRGAAYRIWQRCEELQTTPPPDAPTGTSLVLANLYASEHAANHALVVAGGVTLVTKARRQSPVVVSAFNRGKEFANSVQLQTQIK